MNMRRKARTNAQSQVASLTPRSSEAGRRISTKIGQSQSLDSQLRASYNTPSLRTPMRERGGITPVARTPRTKREISALESTPRSTPQTKKQKVSDASLTDGLLA
eukprot:TRINITY_DN7174_c0_g1_i1.p1 TRINITY_DN7174_c0_g1~~TRINITY_DN7174_c0_g1_i1.p1  ORF type:complete len:105 (-),score=19.52 TRINITY_DN7174_c0_g1_i1:93-407(-)